MSIRLNTPSYPDDAVLIAKAEAQAKEHTQDKFIIDKYAARIELTMSAAKIAWWEMDIESGQVVFDRRKTDMLGRSQKEFRHYSDFMTLVHPDDRDMAMNAMRDHFNGIVGRYETEYRILTKAGDYKWFYDIGSISERDSHGKALKVAGIVIDITERKKGEERVVNLLRDKELLLHEVHHRVKNNMSIVMSMLNLQSSAMKDAAAATALRDAGNRMRSMLVLYDQLYRSENLGQVSTMIFLSHLLDQIADTFPNKDLVAIEKQIGDFPLDVAKLPPVGIIVNELVTNSMKYAFVGRENGRIMVSASLEGRRVEIVIGDNGVGIPASIDVETSPGFGMQLVDMLAKQLEGTIRIERGNGTKFVLEFEV